jgi:hypothetical protein
MELLSIIMSMIGGEERALILIILLFPLITLLLVIVALIDVIKHEFKGNDKVIWVLVVILLPIIGAILYFSIGKNQQIKNG